MNNFVLQHPLGMIISAQTTEEEAAKYGQLTRQIENGHNWYSLTLWQEPDIALGLSLCFFYSKLAFVQLAAVDDKFGTSWDDWSEDKEHLRVNETKAWLERNKLKIGVYDWGTVDCRYDAKSSLGYADIWLFCNQDVFLGQKLTMGEFAAIRQILINLMGNWQKGYAKN